MPHQLRARGVSARWLALPLHELVIFLRHGSVTHCLLVPTLVILTRSRIFNKTILLIVLYLLDGRRQLLLGLKIIEIDLLEFTMLPEDFFFHVILDRLDPALAFSVGVDTLRLRQGCLGRLSSSFQGAGCVSRVLVLPKLFVEILVQIG